MKPKVDQDEVKGRLARILKKPGNETCADCKVKGPAWASFIKPQQTFALGSKVMVAFVCLQCAGHHRKLGTHICFVRSVTLDDWKVGQVDSAESSGNEIVNEIFEGNRNKALSNNPNGASGNVDIKTLQESHTASREIFIRHKYAELYFYCKSSHYKFLSDVQKIEVSSRQNALQSPGLIRKKLSSFLSDGNRGNKLTASKSECSLTVGNTTSTASEEKGSHSMPKKLTKTNNTEEIGRAHV